jgi:hypothetical protein
VSFFAQEINFQIVSQRLQCRGFETLTTVDCLGASPKNPPRRARFPGEQVDFDPFSRGSPDRSSWTAKVAGFHLKLHSLTGPPDYQLVTDNQESHYQLKNPSRVEA